MNSTKIAFIIPGFEHSAKTKGYKEIAGMFQRQGIIPVIIKIDWLYKTMTDYVNQFLKETKKYNYKEAYVLGFSFGSMISFASSSVINPKLQILCSLSPYFKEDLPNLKKWWLSTIGKKRVSDLKQYSSKIIARNTRCETILMAGTREGVEVEKRALVTHKAIKNSKLLFIEDSKHDISNANYLKEIKKVISML